VRRLVLPVLLALAGACTAREPRTIAAGDLEVRGAFAFAPPTASEAAGYFTIVNRGREPDTLLTATSPIAGAAMLHGQVPDGGMVRMEHISAPAIPAGDSLVLAPGGTHLMLMTLDRLPKAGDTIAVTLTFARAGAVNVSLPVRAYGDAP
jgi:copper(I)-binding protein